MFWQKSITIVSVFVLLILGFTPIYADNITTNHNSVMYNTNDTTLNNPTQCDKQCQEKLQQALNEYRKELQKSLHLSPQHSLGVEMSISQPNSQNLQQPFTVLNFYSGTTTLEGKTPVGASTLFAIGSTTKAFTTAIMLQLEKEGKLSLQDAVGKWLPEYNDPRWQKTTINQLIHMTSGFYDYLDLGLEKVMADDPTAYWSAKKLIDWAYAAGPMCKEKEEGGCPFDPNKPIWNYSNTNFVILEQIIEKASGQSLAILITERLLKPLRLHHSIYDPAIIPEKLPTLAHGYNREQDSPFYGKDASNVSMSFARGAGCIISTAEDLTIWMRAIFSGKVFPLESKQFATMTSVVCKNAKGNCIPGKPLAPDDPKGGYSSGLGRVIIEPYGIIWGTDGGTKGHQTASFYFPKTNTIISFTRNVATEDFDDYFGLLTTKIYPILYPK